ncbi:4Fe-4S binding protein [Desulfovibrio psychrotolerans]|uniref:4Fe-4S binding protein n=1 Tax=Desulfovibrio psychrotolerans TaxID=415242 RepID=UPI0035A21D00
MDHQGVNGSSPRVDSSMCIGCGVCSVVCPEQIIVKVGNTYIVGDGCTNCGVCVSSCPTEAVKR